MANWIGMPKTSKNSKFLAKIGHQGRDFGLIYVRDVKEDRKYVW